MNGRLVKAASSTGGIKRQRTLEDLGQPEVEEYKIDPWRFSGLLMHGRSNSEPQVQKLGALLKLALDYDKLVEKEDRFGSQWTDWSSTGSASEFADLCRQLTVHFFCEPYNERDIKHYLAANNHVQLLVDVQLHQTCATSNWDRLGYTPMHHAAAFGHVEAFVALCAEHEESMSWVAQTFEETPYYLALHSARAIHLEKEGVQQGELRGRIAILSILALEACGYHIGDYSLARAAGLADKFGWIETGNLQRVAELCYPPSNNSAKMIVDTLTLAGILPYGKLVCPDSTVVSTDAANCLMSKQRPTQATSDSTVAWNHQTHWDWY